MKRFKHLLVHLDLEGNHDLAAIRYASAVSRLGHSQRVEFVHTGPAPTFFGGTLNDSPDRTAAWLRQANVEVERLIHRNFRGPEGCRVRVRVLGGAGFHDLLDQLRQGDTDLILVGKSETNSAFVEKLARKAPCSVMVVPPGRSVAYRRILVTTDFSDHSARAMEVAVAFAKARKLKQLRCFHAYQIPAVNTRPASRGSSSERNWSHGRRTATENSKRRSTGADSRRLSPARKVRWRRGRFSDRPRSSRAICS